jgi:hypothetical protein
MRPVRDITSQPFGKLPWRTRVGRTLAVSGIDLLNCHSQLISGFSPVHDNGTSHRIAERYCRLVATITRSADLPRQSIFRFHPNRLAGNDATPRFDGPAEFVDQRQGGNVLHESGLGMVFDFE